MNYLVSLRHLNMPKGLYSSIAGIGKMTSLQELHDFSVERSSGSMITELQFMNDLLELRVSQLENIVTRDEACHARLRDKQHLEKLHLSWTDTSPQEEYASDEWSFFSESSNEWSESEDESLLLFEYFTDTARDVLEALEPHCNLKHLHVSGYSGASFPAWLGTSVTCLQTLYLENCGGLQVLPSLERLPLLTKLKLRKIWKVRQVSVPSLEELVLIDMPKLKRCSCNSMRDLNSSLRALMIKRCHALKVFPLFVSCTKLIIDQKSWLCGLSMLTIFDCPQLIVSNLLPPSSNACKLTIARVSTVPTMEGSTNGKLIIGADDDEEEDLLFYECSKNLTELDDKIVSFHNLRALTSLQLEKCQNISAISLEGFRPEHAPEDMAHTNFNTLPSLKHLRINSCGITGKWLSVMLRDAPALEELDLADCNQISELLIEGKERTSSSHTSTPWASSAGNLDDALTRINPDGLLRIPSTLIPSLKNMSIVSCYELTFQGKKEGFSDLTFLEELKFLNCPKLIPSLVHKYKNSDHRNGRWVLPHPLGKLSIDCSPETLQPCFLEVRNCLQKLEISFNQCLKFLLLHSCTALEELMIESYASLATLEGNFTSLQKLELSANQRLKSLQLRSCTALEELTIQNCESLTVLEGNFTRLKELVLCGNSRLESLQLHSCTALEYLMIRNCESLTAVEGFQSLTGLRCLKVSQCPGLTPCLEHLLSQGYELCPRLESLDIDDYSFLATSFCKCLTSLQRLEFYAPQGGVTTLTDEHERALQLLTSLQELRFSRCNKLRDFPVGMYSLLSLKRLEIFDCPRISRLPEKGLPLSLEELEIKRSNEELTDQCRKLATSRLKVKIDWW